MLYPPLHRPVPRFLVVARSLWGGRDYRFKELGERELLDKALEIFLFGFSVDLRAKGVT